MDQFFYSTQIYDDFIILPEDESLHALTVLRKNIGDKLLRKAAENIVRTT